MVGSIWKINLNIKDKDLPALRPSSANFWNLGSEELDGMSLSDCAPSSSSFPSSSSAGPPPPATHPNGAAAFDIVFRFESLRGDFHADSEPHEGRVFLHSLGHATNRWKGQLGSRWRRAVCLRADLEPVASLVSSLSCFGFPRRRRANCAVLEGIGEQEASESPYAVASTDGKWEANSWQSQKNAFANWMGSLKKSVHLSNELPRLNKGAVDSSKHLLAGAVSAIVSRTVVAPLERLKLEYMVCGATSSAPVVINQILANEGPLGFWRGNALNLLRTVPFKAINFCSFDIYRKKLSEMCGESNFSRLVAGAGAGITATLICFPMDTIRTRMVAMGGQGFRNIGSCFSEMIKAGGIISVYRGIVPALVSMAPSGAVFYGTYDFLKTSHLRSPKFQAKLKALQAEEERLKLENGDESVVIFSPKQLELGSVRTLLYGAVSGALAEITTYPLEVVRRQMQLNPNRIGAWETFRLVLKTGGIKALYSGLLPSTLQVLPSAALSYFVYEFVKAQLDIQE